MSMNAYLWKIFDEAWLYKKFEFQMLLMIVKNFNENILVKDDDHSKYNAESIDDELPGTKYSSVNWISNLKLLFVNMFNSFLKE